MHACRVASSILPSEGGLDAQLAHGERPVRSEFGPKSARPGRRHHLGSWMGLRLGKSMPQPVNPAKLLALPTAHRAKFGPNSVRRIRGGNG